MCTALVYYDGLGKGHKELRQLPPIPALAVILHPPMSDAWGFKVHSVNKTERKRGGRRQIKRGRDGLMKRRWNGRETQRKRENSAIVPICLEWHGDKGKGKSVSYLL